MLIIGKVPLHVLVVCITCLVSVQGASDNELFFVCAPWWNLLGMARGSPLVVQLEWVLHWLKASNPK